jgi:hypothetical protein
MSEQSQRVEAAMPWMTGLLLACPVLFAYYPPMTDLAYHEGAIGLLRFFNDSSMVPRGLYVHNFGEPNQLFHLLGWALSYVVSTRWAVKLLVAAAVLGIPIGAARFARHIGASPMAAVVVSPMALGWMFSWGLVANLIGLWALLLSLPALDRFARTPGSRSALPAFGGLVLLYFAHEAMMILYAGVALGLAALHPWSWKKTAWRLSPFLAGVGITALQAAWQRRFMTPVVEQVPRTWDSFWGKLARIPHILMPESDAVVQLSMVALCAFAIVSFAWLRARERKAAPVSTTSDLAPSPVRLRMLQYRWELLAGACLLAYFAFPATIIGATLVYQRWFPPAFALGAVALAPRELWTRAGRVPSLALLALPIAALFVAVPSFIDSSREYEALALILPAIEPGSAVARLTVRRWDPSRSYSLGPAPGRVLATRGGRLAYAFTSSPVSPVVIPPQYQWNESLERIEPNAWDFRPADDFKRFRYALVYTDSVGADLAVLALQPEAELVAEAGDWRLFRSKLPVVPVLSPEAPLETNPAENLGARIHKLLVTRAQDAPGRSERPF